MELKNILHPHLIADIPPLQSGIAVLIWSMWRALTPSPVGNTCVTSPNIAFSGILLFASPLFIYLEIYIFARNQEIRKQIKSSKNDERRTFIQKSR